jgi:dTDP-4-amino-4,6-dideoxygalactose transaminase
MSDLATFSFYPTKNLGAIGDGGMVAGNNPEPLSRVRMLREYGWQQRYVSESPGVNSRLDELQAAILRFRLPFLEQGNLRRAEIAALYAEGLADSGIVLPGRAASAVHVYHQYVIRLAARDSLRERLKERGVGTNIHYPVPIHMQPAYLSRCAADPAGLPITEGIAGQTLSLPMYPELTDDVVGEVITAIRDSL